MDARQIVESLVFSAVRKKVAEWGENAEISVSLEIPRQESHGDFSTNAAMQLAKRLGRKPRAVAEEIVAALREEDRRGRFASLSIAGPGFINIVLSEEFWREVLTVALEKGPRFGASKIGEGKTVHLEFVSANPTGPLHVGHGR
ncbi:MAG: arginyl-tRNA synthetase, partial [Deltaproteobacteria bacterium]|nr:arginyl-tRNA synthetase [Deltaproteobacteria bacterium]MBP2685991.1 arginyl-tRNA synthetase [Deltaproteobacteria bacterium]